MFRILTVFLKTQSIFLTSFLNLFGDLVLFHRLAFIDPVQFLFEAPEKCLAEINSQTETGKVISSANISLGRCRLKTTIAAF